MTPDKLTKENLIEQIRSAHTVLYPYALICNPFNAKLIKDTIEELQLNHILFDESPLVPEETMYLMERSVYEDFKRDEQTNPWRLK